MILQGKAKTPVTGIFIHCTATSPNWRAGDTSAQRVAEVRRWHVTPKPDGRGWNDIGYHWLIDRDGTIMPGRQETTVGAHVAGHNQGTLGTCLFGGQGSRPDDPFLENFTVKQETALLRLLADIKSRTKIAWVRGHNQVDNGKACPGFWVPSWLTGHRL